MLTGEYTTVRTNHRLILTTYPWSRGGLRPPWSRRWPAYKDGLIERGTLAYGDYLGALCNQYGVDVVSGYYQAVSDNPLINFRKSMWATTKLGNVKLCHMFGLEGFPGTRAAIQAEVIRWGVDMQSPKYARIRTNASTYPILMFWGNQYINGYQQFLDMIGVIRTELAKVVGKVFIIGTDHITGLVNTGNPDALRVLNAIDGVYHHACGLPWETCGGCDKSNVQWTATQSAEQLARDLAAESTLVARHGRYFLPGTMPSFDRDLFERDGSAPQGRVVATTPADLRKLFTTTRSYSTPAYTESQIVNGVEQIYEENWSVVTSGAEWEEGSTVEPSLVRGTAYTAPNFDYGNDRMLALSEVFREVVRRQRL